ncbi:MAG: zf-HC2 domain-containing protein [Chitinophagales bacterium]|nr:zf-HC2 domain-containing protein [Chitinophagales bacterium]
MPKKWGIKKIADAMGFSTKKEDNCKETLKRVILSLDGELTEEEEKNFLQHINTCSHCLEKYNIEKCFKEFLTQKLKRHTAPIQIADKIRAHIVGRFPRQ